MEKWEVSDIEISKDASAALNTIKETLTKLTIKSRQRPISKTKLFNVCLEWLLLRKNQWAFCGSWAWNNYLPDWAQLEPSDMDIILLEANNYQQLLQFVQDISSYLMVYFNYYTFTIRESQHNKSNTLRLICEDTAFLDISFCDPTSTASAELLHLEQGAEGYNYVGLDYIVADLSKILTLDTALYRRDKDLQRLKRLQRCAQSGDMGTLSEQLNKRLLQLCNQHSLNEFSKKQQCKSEICQKKLVSLKSKHEQEVQSYKTEIQKLNSRCSERQKLLEDKNRQIKVQSEGWAEKLQTVAFERDKFAEENQQLLAQNQALSLDLERLRQSDIEKENALKKFTRTRKKVNPETSSARSQREDEIALLQASIKNHLQLQKQSEKIIESQENDIVALKKNVTQMDTQMRGLIEKVKEQMKKKDELTRERDSLRQENNMVISAYSSSTSSYQTAVATLLWQNSFKIRAVYSSKQNDIVVDKGKLKTDTLLCPRCFKETVLTGDKLIVNTDDNHVLLICEYHYFANSIYDIEPENIDEFLDAYKRMFEASAYQVTNGTLHLGTESTDVNQGFIALPLKGVRKIEPVINNTYKGKTVFMENDDYVWFMCSGCLLINLQELINNNRRIEEDDFLSIDQCDIFQSN